MNNPFSVYLHSGLGNQMFQFAFGLNFGLKHNRTFFTGFGRMSEHTRKIYIDELFSSVPFFSIEEKDFQDFHFHYEPTDYLFKFHEVENLTNCTPVYCGYFQSEKYFLENKDYVIECLTPKIENENELKQKYDKLDSSYFLHVRRGDYLKSKVHYIPLDNYYKKCLDYIGNDHIYVVSDDLNWCRNAFNGLNVTFVDEDEVSSMWIMSKCWKGGICANSTFSWWGAYLNKNPDKKCYFPNKWIHGDKEYYEDVYPSFAIRVEI